MNRNTGNGISVHECGLRDCWNGQWEWREKSNRLNKGNKDLGGTPWDWKTWIAMIVMMFKIGLFWLECLPEQVWNSPPRVKKTSEVVVTYCMRHAISCPCWATEGACLFLPSQDESRSYLNFWFSLLSYRFPAYLTFYCNSSLAALLVLGHSHFLLHSTHSNWSSAVVFYSCFDLNNITYQ